MVSACIDYVQCYSNLMQVCIKSLILFGLTRSKLPTLLDHTITTVKPFASHFRKCHIFTHPNVAHLEWVWIWLRGHITPALCDAIVTNSAMYFIIDYNNDTSFSLLAMPFWTRQICFEAVWDCRPFALSLFCVYRPSYDSATVHVLLN